MPSMCIWMHRASLAGSRYGTVYLSGDNLVSGTVEINAKPEKTVISTDSIVRFGDLPLLEITKKASVTVQSGKIASMTVASGAKGSVITLSNDVEVDNLTVNAAVSFRGKGEIASAVNNVSGVTYETRPNKVTGKDSSSGSSGETDPDGYFSPSLISPSKSETGVSIGTDIVLAFGRTVYDADGDNLTESYIRRNFELHRSSATGTEISFDVSMSSAHRQITLVPDEKLDYGTRYYVVAKAGVLTDTNGDKNSAISTYFTTVSSGSFSSDTSSKITFSPKNGASDVSTSGKMTITFSSAVYDLDGDHADLLISLPSGDRASRKEHERNDRADLGHHQLDTQGVDRNTGRGLEYQHALLFNRG